MCVLIKFFYVQDDQLSKKQMETKIKTIVDYSKVN